MWHFMQIVSTGDNLQEMSKPVFSGKDKKKKNEKKKKQKQKKKKKTWWVVKGKQYDKGTLCYMPTARDQSKRRMSAVK